MQRATIIGVLPSLGARAVPVAPLLIEHVQQWLGKSQYLSWDIWYYSAADFIFVALNNDTTYNIRKVVSSTAVQIQKNV